MHDKYFYIYSISMGICYVLSVDLYLNRRKLQFCMDPLAVAKLIQSR